jgi:NAD(P)-dependent dehydrogenase (short-subunit alcohol dehydrogenase family)
MLEAIPGRATPRGWSYRPTWKRGAVISSPTNGHRAAGRLGWLVFADAIGLAEHLTSRLERDGDRVAWVSPGRRYEALGRSRYEIRPAVAEDYERLLADLARRGGLPDRVAHLSTLTEAAADGATFDRSRLMEIGYFSIVRLVQAWGKAAEDRSLEVLVVSNGLCEVTGDERLVPEKATLIGPLLVIPQEYENIRCRIVDIDPRCGLAESAERVLSERFLDRSEPSVALRGGHRWLPDYEPMEIRRRKVAARLRQGGVYLLTGGLGGIGLRVARHLASRYEAKLILVGRRALPERTEWRAWLDSHGEDDRVSVTLRLLREIEAAGGEVMVARADVSCRQEVEEVVAAALRRFGRIHGLVHAAGLPPAGLVQLWQAGRALEVLAPKIEGARALEAVLGDRDLDFAVFFSSLNSVVGGVGTVDYAAANAFLDAFARQNDFAPRTATITVDWDVWQGLGMAAAEVLEHEALNAGHAGRAIQPREGVEMFERLLDTAESRVVVSALDLGQVVERSRRFQLGSDSGVEDSRVTPGDRAADTRPALDIPYVAPARDLERLIAAIWRELLGIERIGVHDGFLELGGHSLLATQALARLKSRHGIRLSIHEFFEAATIRRQAELIAARDGIGEAVSPPDPEAEFEEGRV